MATNLELTQAAARESGTVSGTQPLTTIGQTGRLGQFVGWVRDAYLAIQNIHPEWRFLRSSFSGSTVAAQQAYTGANFSLTRFSEFIYKAGEDEITIYLTSDGAATERALMPVLYQDFYRLYMRGANLTQTGYPTTFTIDDQERLLLWPIPDAVYTVRGLYRKSPQTLAADAEEPEMPSRFHDAIKWRALIYAGIYDESPQIGLWQREYQRILMQMENSQLPPVTFSGPLA